MKFLKKITLRLSELELIFTLGSVLFLIAVIKLERKVSSWWSPSLGTTSFPTTTEVTNCFVKSAAGKLVISVEYYKFIFLAVNHSGTLIILPVASKRNSGGWDIHLLITKLKWRLSLRLTNVRLGLTEIQVYHFQFCARTPSQADFRSLTYSGCKQRTGPYPVKINVNI